MFIIDIFLLLLLSAICVYALIADIKNGKIKNLVLLVSGLILVVAIAVKLIVFDREDVIDYLKNAGILCAIGFAGYLIKLWAGGDCKILVLIALAFPSLFYFDYNNVRITLWWIPAIAFILSFVYLLVDSVAKSIRKREEFDIKRMLSTLKQYILLYLKAFVYMTALNLIYSAFVYPCFQLHPVVYFILSLLLMLVIGKAKILGNIWAVIGVLAVDIALMLILHDFVILTYWKNYLMVFVFIILKSFMSLYNYQVIKTSDVTAGMVLSKVDTLFMQQSKVKGLPDISDESLRSRLSAEEAESVVRWGSSKYGKEQVTIVRKMPFAAFISIATLIYSTIGVLQYCGLL